MSARAPAFATSPTNPSLGEIQTLPERKPDMPYAPAIRVEAPGDLLFISGATPSPLYHKHPHDLLRAQSSSAHRGADAARDGEHQDPSSTIEGLTWTDS